MNLLPITEKETLKKGLKLRLVGAALFLLSAVFFIGFVMLLPAYLLTLEYLPKDDTKNNSPERKDDNAIKEVLKLPEEINSKLKLFQSNINNISVIDYFSKIVNFLPKNVTLNSISFSRDQNYKEKNGLLILVSGIAIERDSLVLFSNSLKESGLFSSVDVPVSSLTKDRNLPFSMNIFTEN